MFAGRAEARAFVEDRGGYGFTLTCVTFLLQFVTAMLLLVLFLG
jgi:hypothetical protein